MWVATIIHREKYANGQFPQTKSTSLHKPLGYISHYNNTQVKAHTQTVPTD